MSASSRSRGDAGDVAALARASARGVWLPLIVVIGVLAVLAAAPAIVSRRERHLRAFISDVADPARLHAANVAASLADEMFAVAMSSARGVRERVAPYGDALGVERRNVLALDSLVRLVGPEAVEQFAQYREEARRWHDDVGAIGERQPTGAELDTARLDALASRQAVRQLAATLDQTASASRADARALEQVDVTLPGLLVPLALLACVLIVRAGREMASIMVQSESDRAALAVAMREKSMLIRGITHDLQNPLGAARGHVDLMLDGVLPPTESRDALHRVRRLLTTTIESVAGLLAVARSDTGAIELAPERFDVGAIARSAVDDSQPLALLKGQTLALDVESGCRALGDPGRVRHILDNLLSNAIKYAPRGGRIRVTLTRVSREQRDWCAVLVEDSGPGVPVEWRERIFEEFVRIPGTAGTPGNGIGLTASRRVARMMGGDVTADDAAVRQVLNGHPALGGAVFTLWLVCSDQLEGGIGPAR